MRELLASSLFDCFTVLEDGDFNKATLFKVGDIVERADGVDKGETFKIVSIVKSARLNYKNKVVIKHRVQVKSEKSGSTVISYSKNFPYKKVLPKAGEAEKVD